MLSISHANDVTLDNDSGRQFEGDCRSEGTSNDHQW